MTTAVQASFGHSWKSPAGRPRPLSPLPGCGATKDAVLRVGALLVVKVDWTVQVFQLTAAQQALLDHQPQLATRPHEIIAVLQLSDAEVESLPPTRSFQERP